MQKKIAAAATGGMLSCRGSKTEIPARINKSHRPAVSMLWPTLLNLCAGECQCEVCDPGPQVICGLLQITCQFKEGE
jgi:hypothetical protein